MLDKDKIELINNFFPKQLSDQFIFPIDKYILFLEKLSINPMIFFKEWSDINRQEIVNKYWDSSTNFDWKWCLAYPFFSILEKHICHYSNPKIIGFSGLPGSGKSTLGVWIDNVAKEMGLDMKVISLDDFYLPGRDMDIAMSGNPWNVPRGFPGSHSIELLNNTLSTFLQEGVLNSPTFDKSLRGGKGDRSGWFKSKPKILILEGWFIGCEPISDLFEIDHLTEENITHSLSDDEKTYRRSIQVSLNKYSKVWSKLDKIWHLKSNHFNNIILWKGQQEKEMIKLKGSGLKGKDLINFIRMIQTCIPQKSLNYINSDTTIQINKNRRIENLYTKTYFF